ncbi:YoaK family protein [Methylovirgula sp. 4M-Z18]|uniref:YoaK family protein n=1 Tax=Methylovirgula sp. 4M-Z18 TaxID=2293567 RepID=UPI000E2E8642|nr:YoaK family protein [Methylovirgula sp. 4M-Z18]RFB78185.1 DUF1275 domain-containing protein [Methylovirgula sp. 4M-Z18]
MTNDNSPSLRTQLGDYFRQLAGRQRSDSADRALALLLTLVAGAANTSGFLALEQYTSHMSGVVSSIAGRLVAGDFMLLLTASLAFAAFVGGAGASAIVVLWARRRAWQSEYALPLLIEAALLVGFSFVGEYLADEGEVYAIFAIMFLSFNMGLQNGIITTLSRARFRATHITGLVTDLGIECGKALYPNGKIGPSDPDFIRADAEKLKLVGSLIGMFFIGGVCGAFGFDLIGFTVMLILAALLVAIALAPVWDDLMAKRA